MLNLLSALFISEKVENVMSLFKIKFFGAQRYFWTHMFHKSRKAILYFIHHKIEMTENAMPLCTL